MMGRRFLAVALVSVAACALPAGTASAAPTAPYLDAVARYLNQRSPGTEDNVWWLTEGNVLPEGWLLQTVDCWTRPECSRPAPGMTHILNRMASIVADARKSVDIAQLYQIGSLKRPAPGYPNGEFFDKIVEGLKEGHKRHPNEVPVVRLLIGLHPPGFYFPSTFTNALKKAVGNWVKVQSGVMRTKLTSFNHEKVVDADGHNAIVGGMNYWSSDYVATDHPVSDLSMQVVGPAAAKVSQFTDILWKYTCHHIGATGVSVDRHNVGHCIEDIPTDKTSGRGPRASSSGELSGVPIMVVGKLGQGIDVPGHPGQESPAIPSTPWDGSKVLNGGKGGCPGVDLFGQREFGDVNGSRSYEYRNPGEDALRALVESAKHSVFLSQQDLLSCVPQPLPPTEETFDERLVQALAQKVLDGVPIKIVVSDSPKGGGYGNGWPVQDVAQTLTAMVAAQAKLDRNTARDRVCRDVGLATIRSISGRAKWPDGERFWNHAKLVSVDDQAFYIGSGNVYPSRLQELGLIVENPAASAQLKSAYLDPLWSTSRGDALIDPQQNRCSSF